STTTECHRGQLSCSLQSHIIHGVVAERVGFEPTIRGKPYDDLANRCLQPLGHLSVAQSPIVSTVSRQTFTENRGEKRMTARCASPERRTRPPNLGVGA